MKLKSNITTHVYVQHRAQKDAELRHYLDIYRRLDPTDQMIIDGAVANLMERVKGIGIGNALIAVAKLGEFIAKR